jgi:hypothetical protein
VSVAPSVPSDQYLLPCACTVQATLHRGTQNDIAGRTRDWREVNLGA